MTDQPARKPLDPNKRLAMAVAYINQMHRRNAGTASDSQQATR